MSFYFTHMRFLPAFFYVNNLMLQAGQRRASGFPEVELADGYEPPCGFWEPSTGPLQAQ